MKKEKSEVKTKRHLDKGQMFVRIMAFVLAGMMVFGTIGTLVFAIIG